MLENTKTKFTILTCSHNIFENFKLVQSKKKHDISLNNSKQKYFNSTQNVSIRKTI